MAAGKWVYSSPLTLTAPILDPEEEKDRSFKAGQARAHTMILHLLKLFLDNVAPLFLVYLGPSVISLVQLVSVEQDR